MAAITNAEELVLASASDCLVGLPWDYCYGYYAYLNKPENEQKLAVGYFMATNRESAIGQVEFLKRNILRPVSDRRWYITRWLPPSPFPEDM